MKELYNEKFMKQNMMRTVLTSLIPIIIASVYFFGWRVLLLLIVVNIAGVITEGIFAKKMGRKISEAVFISSTLYTLTLPPSTPFWVAVIGIIFGIVFAKEVFGGFGRNVFNPALAARAFVYVCFPAPLTMYWNEASFGGLGGFTTYLTQGIDTVAQATPMLLFRDTGDLTSINKLLIGNTSGAIGETCAILIILAAAYLIYKKVASWEVMLSTVIGYVGLSLILRAFGNTQIVDPIHGVLMGGFLFGTVFMATDPITAPKTKEGKWIFGLLVGIVTVIIRGYALFAGGMMFAILISNTFVPILDEAVRYLKNRKKETEKGVAS